MFASELDGTVSNNHGYGYKSKNRANKAFENLNPAVKPVILASEPFRLKIFSLLENLEKVEENEIKNDSKSQKGLKSPHSFLKFYACDQHLLNEYISVHLNVRDFNLPSKEIRIQICVFRI